MPKYRQPPQIDAIELFEQLQALLESTKKDLTKCITKGTKRAGIDSRKNLRAAKIMIRDIIDISLVKQREVRADRPKHGNANGPGVLAMQARRKQRIAERKQKQ